MTEPKAAELYDYIGKLDKVSLAIVHLAAKLSQITVHAPTAMQPELDDTRKLLLAAEQKLWGVAFDKSDTSSGGEGGVLP